MCGWPHTAVYLMGFETTRSSWKVWSYIVFIPIILKKIRKREKSR